MRKRRNTLISPEKYDLGDFVTKNQQNINAGFAGAASLGAMTGNDTIAGATSGMSSGAALGTAVMPGIGTALGAVGGAIFGGIFGGKKAAAKRKEALRKEEVRKGLVNDQFESDIDTVNENPYGVYEDGGDIGMNIINIEKGELQINPENGKIIREFTGINPETGGLYEPHSKGEDTINNLVNAEEGTFIISKDKSSAYKNAIKNNDKLHQNSILQNIRNRKKELTSKYAKGGDINRFNPLLDQVNPYGLTNSSTINTNPYNPDIIGKLPKYNTNAYLDPVQNNNNSWNDLFGYGIGLYNMAKGSQAPEKQPYRLTSPSVRNRQQILNNMPNTVSVNPALNSIAGNAYNTNQDILANTSNPAIARALLLANSANTNNAFNDAYYQNNNINNSIMGTRANIYSNLAQSDEALRSANNRSILETDETNRALRLAKEQQFNTGLSQLQENWRNNQSIRGQQRNDRLRLRLLQDTNPYLKYYSGNWRDNLDQNIR